MWAHAQAALKAVEGNIGRVSAGTAGADTVLCLEAVLLCFAKVTELALSRLVQPSFISRSSFFSLPSLLLAPPWECTHQGCLLSGWTDFILKMWILGEGRGGEQGEWGGRYHEKYHKARAEGKKNPTLPLSKVRSAINNPSVFWLRIFGTYACNGKDCV